MAQITSIVSETLQAKIRSLLPSQAGFTEDLQAQNVIVPIIDLTETASGSTLREDLQTAIDTATGSEILDSVSTVTIVNTTGFWRVYGTISHKPAGSDVVSKILLNDGATDNQIFALTTSSDAGSDDPVYAIPLDLIVYVRAGDSIKITQNNTNSNMSIFYRQIADINGNLTNPTGFTSE